MSNMPVYCGGGGSRSKWVLLARMNEKLGVWSPALQCDLLSPYIHPVGQSAKPCGQMNQISLLIGKGKKKKDVRTKEPNTHIIELSHFCCRPKD